jgi:hypothetical protein
MNAKIQFLTECRMQCPDASHIASTLVYRCPTQHLLACPAQLLLLNAQFSYIQRSIPTNGLLFIIRAVIFLLDQYTKQLLTEFIFLIRFPSLLVILSISIYLLTRLTNCTPRAAVGSWQH